MYDGRVCRTLLETILIRQCDRYLNEQVLTKVDLNLDDFKALVALHRK